MEEDFASLQLSAEPHNGSAAQPFCHFAAQPSDLPTGQLCSPSAPQSLHVADDHPHSPSTPQPLTPNRLESAGLPGELLPHILNFIESHEIMAFCGAVCKDWRLVTMSGYTSDLIWEGMWVRRKWKSGWMRSEVAADWRSNYMLRHIEELELTRRASVIVDQSMKQLQRFKSALEIQRQTQEKALLQRLEARRLKRSQSRKLDGESGGLEGSVSEGMRD